jgi:predicted metalloprotease
MRWRDMRQSDNVEDRRGMGGFGGFGGGGFRPSGMGGLGGLGLGGIVIVLLISWLFGVNPLSLLGGGSNVDQYSTDPAATGTGGDTTGVPTDEGGKFASSILGDTEDFWTAYFRNAGSSYTAPKLVLFTDEVQSACGTSSAAVGPFYCPNDRRVYIDLSFFQALARQFGAPGDFAKAYVIAHEVGHHVQNLAGVLNRGNPMSRTQANAISVQQELQADCLAGMWGRSASTRNLLEPGDAEAGLRAAAAIGDDRLQRASQGRVMPETFTHGSSEQRVAALRQGLNSTDLSGCGIR